MNRRLFLSAALIAPLARAREMTWEELIRRSNAYTSACSDQLDKQYEFTKHERWNLDQDKGEIIFSNGGVGVLATKFQFVGSVSKKSGTWLWSWANSSVLPNLSKDMEKVRRYGEAGGFIRLTESKWAADETDGWEMAAVANYILKGKGVYRPPINNGVVFVVLTDVKKLNQK